MACFCRRRRVIGCAAMLAILLAGCRKRDASTQPAAPAATASAGALNVSVQGSAAITGVVHLRGTPPALPRIDVSSVRDCAARHPNGLPDESIVINDNGTLRNVIVHLNGPIVAFDGERQAALLDQAGCRYVPHVIAIQTGQRLAIKSSDPFLHNVHGLTALNPGFNFAQPGPGVKELEGFSQSETFPVRCDVHPWMKAWVGIFDNPWFAVTGADGAYRLANVPPGSYTLVAWQERLGELTHQVTVPKDGTLKIEFEYSR